jgi:hypothetical protein
MQVYRTIRARLPCSAHVTPKRNTLVRSISTWHLFFIFYVPATFFSTNTNKWSLKWVQERVYFIHRVCYCLLLIMRWRSRRILVIKSVHIYFEARVHFFGHDGWRQVSTHSRPLYVEGVIVDVRDAQILQKYKRHLKFLGARRMESSKFRTEDTQILGTILQNLVATADWCPVLVHLWFSFYSLLRKTVHIPIQIMLYNTVFVFAMIHSSPLKFGALSTRLPYFYYYYVHTVHFD